MIEAIRLATVDDCSWLVDLDRRQRTLAPELRGGPQLVAAWPNRDPSDWSALMSGAASEIFVGTLDDHIMGMAVATLEVDLVLVERIYVVEEARELGFGDGLLQACIDWGRERGAAAIESVTLPGDRQTKNMFERFGIKARALIVRAPLALPAGTATDNAG